MSWIYLHEFPNNDNTKPPSAYVVGFFRLDNHQFAGVKKFESENDAANAVHYLNGGEPPQRVVVANKFGIG